MSLFRSRNWVVWAFVGCLGAVACRADLIVLPIEGSGQAGSGFFPMWQAFDRQPTNVPTVNGAVIPGYDIGTTSNAPSNPSRWGYIDLGTNYANIRIHESWTGYRTFSGSTHVGSPYQNVFWSSTITTNAAGGTPETDINFLTTPTIAHVNSLLWYRDWQAADESEVVTPAERYLILNSPSTMSGRATEYVLVGTVVPEPGSALLLLLGAGVVWCQRHRLARPL